MKYKWIVPIGKDSSVTKSQATELVKNGCKAFIIRSGRGEDVDGMLEKHVKIAEGLNVPFMLVHELDPHTKADAQAARIAGLALQYHPPAIALQVDQWWMDWNEYIAVHVKGLPGYVRPYNENQLVRFYRPIILEVKKALSHLDIKLVGKSSPYFIHAHARQMAAVLRDELDYYWNDSHFAWISAGRDLDVDWQAFNGRMDGSIDVPAEMLPRGFREWSIWTDATIPVAGFGHLTSALVTDEFCIDVLHLGQAVDTLDDLDEKLAEMPEEPEADPEEVAEVEAEAMEKWDDPELEDEPEVKKTSRRKKK